MQADMTTDRPSLAQTTGFLPAAESGESIDDRRFYSPQAELAALNGKGNPRIYRTMEIIRPVAVNSDMMVVMEVFRKNQHEHFFPVLTDEGHVLGLICERDLKEYVYSRYGFCLLAKANRDQPELLVQFLTACPSADITSSTDHLLTVYHEQQGSREGVIITHEGRYLGFLRLAALMELAHERQMQLNAEHHQELARKHREIQVVLKNMRQGICTILPDLTLHPEFSSHLVQTLERDEDDIAGCSVIELLFRRQLSSEQCQIVESALNSILEQDELMYECNSEALPKEVNYQVGGKSKCLELHWSPVVDEHDCVQRMMLVVRDISQMRALQQQAVEHARELTMLGEILSVTPQRFRQFIEGSLTMLAQNRESLEQQHYLRKPDATLNLLYRNLHTIKGNARTLGLLQITEKLHDSEQALQRLRGYELGWPEAALLDDVAELDAAIRDYDDLFRERLANFASDNTGTTGQSVSLSQQVASVLMDVDRTGQAQPWFERLKKTVFCRADAFFADISSALPAIAEDVGKPTPSCEIVTGDLQLSPACLGALGDAMVHLLRNSLAHGIETPEERRLACKPEAGCIRIAVCQEPDALCLLIGDDGQGMALHRIAEKAESLGLLSATETLTDARIAEQIFVPGFSTARDVTHIAGRGVGMDAVRTLLLEHGMTISIELLGSRLPGFRAFQWKITLPEAITALRD